jgi:type IV secretory pathway VirB10-like protein
LQSGPNLRPVPPTRGRHLNKRVALVLVLVLALGAVWVLMPKSGTPPATRSWKPPSEMSRMVKDSRGLQQMKVKEKVQENGLLPSQPLPQVPVVDTSDTDGLKAENARLAKENEQYRALLNKVPPKVESKTTAPARPAVDAAAKQREDERRKLEQTDRKLIVRKASDKDATAQIMKINYPATEFSLSPGWSVSCQTEGMVSNESPGSFRVRTKNPVYDTATGKHVVIPQESLMVMRQRGTTLFGDSRIAVEVSTLTFPNGSWLKFGAASVQDQTGLSGFTGDIDRHYGRLFASVLLTSVLRGGTSALPYSAGDPLSRVGGSVAQETSREAERQTKQVLRTEPTIVVESGQGCLILLEDAVALPRSFEKLQ